MLLRRENTGTERKRMGINYKQYRSIDPGVALRRTHVKYTRETCVVYYTRTPRIRISSTWNHLCVGSYES